MARAKKQVTLFDLGRRAETPVKTPIVAKSETEDVDIACPVCQTSMDSFSMENRIRHVEECLSMAVIHENRSAMAIMNGSTKPPNLKAEAPPQHEIRVAKCDINPEVIEISDDHSSEEKVEIGKLELPISLKSTKKPISQKRKRELAPLQKEKLKYVNTQPLVKRKKEAPLKTGTGTKNEVETEENTDLLPSSRKTEIPDLKIVKFTVSGTTKYSISVDAFCYKPHETIRQYFLSHFHSDHYGGITKRWCRERTFSSKIIYCSEITGRLLNIRYSVEPCHLFSMANDVRYKIHSFQGEIEDGGEISNEKTPGVYVTCIDANHCPGAVIFLFEGICIEGKSTFSLHCGDFRVNKSILRHPLLKEFLLGAGNQLENVYLDTTYMTPKYNFPKQEQVCDSVATLIYELSNSDSFVKQVFGSSMQSRITDFLSLGKKQKGKKYLVLVGTYLIGKEKLAISILKRLGNAPIYVSNVNSRGDKEQIIRSYQDAYLDSVLTNDPVANTNHDVMIHLVPMKIAGNIHELHNYFNHNAYHSHFERCIGLRPTGWSFKSTEEEGNLGEKAGDLEEEVIELEDTQTSLSSTISLLRNQPKYSHLDVVNQNSNQRYGKVDRTTHRIYSIPYSEHLSFRELSYFVVFFNIRHVIPTVNTSNPYSAEAMAEIIRRWEEIRKVLNGCNTGIPIKIQDAARKLSLDEF